MSALYVTIGKTVGSLFSFPTFIRKSGKAYSSISWPFLALEVIILYTCGQQMSTNMWVSGEDFAGMSKN